MGVEQKTGNTGSCYYYARTGGQLVTYQFHVADVVWFGLLCHRDDGCPGSQL